MEQSNPRSKAENDKAIAILKAAFGVFAQYGFKRTTMEDIARAANVSRPALYQHFRNKEDIMRSMSSAYFQDVNTRLEMALNAQGETPTEALAKGFEVLADSVDETVLSSPHGAEMIELTNTVAADIVAEGTQRKEAIFAEWLAQEEALGRIVLDHPAAEVASAIMAALQGAKSPPFKGYRTKIRTLAALFGKGISPL